MTSTERDNTKHIQIEQRYWVRHPLDDAFFPVSKDQYVLAEHDNGFNNTMGQPDEPATAAFSGPDGIRGTTMKPETASNQPRRFDPDHSFYDRSGNKITVEEWGEEYHKDRVLLNRRIQLESGKIIYLRTMYLGMVDLGINGCRLFGTIVTDVVPTAKSDVLVELETYDSATSAYVGHLDHLAAIQSGYHCRFCKIENRPGTASYLKG